MNIYNKKKKVVIDINESTVFIGGTYTIYPITSTNCVVDSPILTGIVPQSRVLELELEDGNYQIKVTSTLSTMQLKQDFKVIYNYIPIFVNTIKQMFCSDTCSNCKPTRDKELENYKRYFEVMSYFNCLGSIYNMPLTRNKSCETINILQDKKEYESYYGTFKFSYMDHLKTIVAYIYAELYYEQANSIKVSENDSKEIYEMFQFEEIEKCMYRFGINLKDLSCQLNNINCECNGL